VVGRALKTARIERDREVGMLPQVDSLGRMLIVLGIVVIALGALLLLVGKVPFLGRLPGDIVIRRESWTVYFPVATSLLVSVLLTLLFWLLGRR
jgi:hypothetical protein